MKVKLEGQEIRALWVHERVARLTVVRSGTIGPESVGPEEFDYWVFKDENWYRIPMQLNDLEWDPDEAHEVAIPQGCSDDSD